MATIDTVNNIEPHNVDGTHPEMYSASAPAVPSLPNSAAALEIATRISDNMAKTFDRFMTALEHWNGLRNFYQGPDQETVYEAFNDRLDRIAAIKLAGDKMFEAYSVYNAALELNAAPARTTYMEWAPGHVTDCSPYQPHINKYCRGDLNAMHLEYEMNLDPRNKEEDRQTLLRMRDLLVARRDKYTEEAYPLYQTIDEARDVLSSTLQDMKMIKLSAIRYETRNEATTVYTSQQDVERSLRESAAFASLNLTDAEITALAEEIWKDRARWETGHYTDEKGREWVMTGEGTMVRAGSAMDPRLNAVVMEKIASDPVVGQREVTFPGMDKGETTTVAALVWGMNKGNSKLTEWGVRQFEGEAANIAGMKVLGKMMGTGLAILSIGASAETYRHAQTMLYPMMSSSDVDERYERALVVETAKTGGGMVVGAGLMFVAAAAGAPTGGIGGVIVATVVDKVTGALVGWIVDTIDASQTSATRDEIDGMSDEELANR